MNDILDYLLSLPCPAYFSNYELVEDSMKKIPDEEMQEPPWINNYIQLSLDNAPELNGKPNPLFALFWTGHGNRLLSYNLPGEVGAIIIYNTQIMGGVMDLAVEAETGLVWMTQQTSNTPHLVDKLLEIIVDLGFRNWGAEDPYRYRTRRLYPQHITIG